MQLELCKTSIIDVNDNTLGHRDADLPILHVDAFNDEQLHEVEQTYLFTTDNDSHRANGLAEMPADLFIRAVKLAEEIPFDKESDFAKSVEGAGGMEQHPAMKLLCFWWETVMPVGEPFKPGMAMPLVRVRDDGEYCWGYPGIPNVPVAGHNPSGQDAAWIGDLILMMFPASQKNAIFDKNKVAVLMPSGSLYSTICIDKESWLAGKYDEALFCLDALAGFQNRFPCAWRFIINSVAVMKPVRY